jgi:PST family polysaccharide transporter
MSARWLGFLPVYLRRHLVDRPVLQKVMANTTWLLLDKALRLAVGLLVVVWVARYLGPEQYGTLNYALAFVALFSALANVGLDSVVVRDIVRHPQDREIILGSAFLLKAVGGVVALLGAVAIVSLTRPEDTLTLALVTLGALSLLLQAFDTVDLWFQSQLQSRYSVWARNIAFLMVAVGKIVLILMQAPLIAFAWAGVAESVLAATCLVAAYRLAKQRLWRWRVSAPRVRMLLRDSWPLVLASVVVMLYMRIDQVMLGAMLGNEAVGIYSAAVRVSELWYVVPASIVASIAPAIVTAREAGPVVYKQKLEQLFRAMVLISYAVTVPMFLVSQPLVVLIFGAEYAAAGPVLAVHVWASLFVALGIASSQYLLLEGLNHVSLQRTAVGAVANVLLNLAWIPRYGALGAAFATLISYAIANFFLLQSPATRYCLGMMLRALWPFPLVTRSPQ